MSRLRKLLPAAALFTATTLFAQSGPVSSPAPIRVAIVGLEHGHVDGFLSSALPHHPEVQLVGISDPDPALLAKYQHKYNFAPSILFKTEAAMIEAAHPQAVLVYTAISGHRPAIEVAAQHGIPVMVEKPLTLTVEDALAIRRAAREHHIQVLVNYETTWYSSNRAASEQAATGQIGPVRRIVVHDGHEGPAEIGVQPEFLNWLTDPAQNGAGALFDFGCYGADLSTVIMHGHAPLTVTAVTNQDKKNDPRYSRVDDDATVILQYPDAQTVLQPSWNWPFARKDMEVYGATGYAITVGLNKVRIRHKHDAEEALTTATPLPDAEKDSLSYLEAVLSGKIVPEGDLTSLDTNMTVVQILAAARESARTGRTIQITPLPAE